MCYITQNLRDVICVNLCGLFVEGRRSCASALVPRFRNLDARSLPTNSELADDASELAGDDTTLALMLMLSG